MVKVTQYQYKPDIINFLSAAHGFIPAIMNVTILFIIIIINLNCFAP